MKNIKHYNHEEQDDYYKSDNISWKECEQELLEKYNIVYDGVGVHPIKIIKSNKIGDNQIYLVIGHEDDGHIWFEKDGINDYKNSFHVSWTEELIKVLEKSLKVISNNQIHE